MLEQIDKEKIEDVYPMSEISRGLIYDSLKKDSFGFVYQNQVTFDIDDESFDTTLFKRAFSLMVEKHSILRTGFLMDGFDEPIQIVYKTIPLNIYHQDISRLDSSQPDKMENSQTPAVDLKPFTFDGTEALWRMKILSSNNGKVKITWEVHHAMIDGWSSAVLLTELLYTYSELKKDENYIPPRLKCSYKDFIIEEMKYKTRQEVIDFWKKELADFTRFEFPGNYQLTPGPPQVKRRIFQLGNDMHKELKKVAIQFNTTVKDLCFAAYMVMLNIISQKNDMLVGLITNTRPGCQDGDKIIGCFINTVPVRLIIPGHIRWNDLITLVKNKILELKPYERFPFSEIVRLAKDQCSGQNSIIDTVFSYLDFHIYNQLQPEGSKEKSDKSVNQNFDQFGQVDNGRTNTLFNFWIDATLDGFSLWIDYSNHLVSDNLLEELSRYFKITLDKFIHEPDGIFRRSDFISAEDKQTILYRFNDTRTEYPRDRSLSELFEAVVEKVPDRIAIQGKDQGIPGNVFLSYQALNQGSNQVARLLRSRGVRSETVVGLMMKRSPGMVTALLAILKSGGAYLPINPDFPENRVVSMLEDCEAPILLSHQETLQDYSFTHLQGLNSARLKPKRTGKRPPILDFDGLPMVDRSLIDNAAYNRYIGHGMVKNSVTLQATRGCPYNCAFCCRVWPRKLVVRSAENIFQEVKTCFDMGVRRFVFIDDIFNFDIKNSLRFFQLVIDHGLDIQILFPSGLRGDILTREYIDLMVEAGTMSFPLSLETASPRLQRLIKKNLNLKRFRENIEYIIENYPQVILELNTMHGLPTESEEEALMTLDFIKSLKYVHFPYVHILRIHSNTAMEKLALESGISMASILRSRDMFYHELPDTLPFDKNFTLKYQADFLNEYFLSRERLLQVLPFQMKSLTEDEIVQKYNSYLPTPIHSFSDLLNFTGIGMEELGEDGFVSEEAFVVPDLDQKFQDHFSKVPCPDSGLRLLLLDLSQFYSAEREMLYDVVEQPLGLMYLLSYLQGRLPGRLHGRIAKSRIDFDSDEELRRLLDEYSPDVIGIRTLTMYRDFFHHAVSLIRHWGIDIPIIAGGPYATNDYDTLLQDMNVDLAVIGEGEATFLQVMEEMVKTGGKLPSEEVLTGIPGIAYIPHKGNRGVSRELLMMDCLDQRLSPGYSRNLESVNGSSDLAYIAYTSGSTGNPKGVMVEHRNVSRLVRETNYIDLGVDDTVLQLSNVAFDGSVFDIFGALLNGSKLVMVSEDEVLDVNCLSRIIEEAGVSVFFVTTALFNVLVDTNMDCFSRVRHVLFGGEKVSFDHVRRAFECLGPERMIHVYGPTETVVYATYHYIRQLDEGLGTVPIGRPLSNTTVYILDKVRDLVPFGVVGELYIGGESVSRGYMNNEGMTHDKFIENQYVPGERLYRTGDLCRWLVDGEIEFIGRVDHQVKLRGFRIELGEIESRILSYEEIKEVVVLNRVERQGNDYLCGYVVLRDPHSGLDFSEFKSRLSRDLPDFMIPSYFVELDEMPLNSSGKINRGALPEPKVGLDKGYVGPRNRLEKKLVKIWSEVLDVDPGVLGIESNFFDFGGHSLKATILISRVHKELGVKVPLTELFRTQTILGISRYIEVSARETHESVDPVEKREYYRLSSAQKRVYVLKQLDTEDVSYNIPAVVHLTGDPDVLRLEHVFRELIRRHEAFRTFFEVVNEEPVQRVSERVDFSIESYFQDIGLEGFVRPFDLGCAPLLRVGVLYSGENRTLLIDMHHIISDGTSHAVLKEEFLSLTAGSRLPCLRLQYRDFAHWEGLDFYQSKLGKQEAFWLKEFSGELPVLHLPIDYPRPLTQHFSGNVVGFTLTREETGVLKRIARESDSTLYMVILSIYNVLLSRLSGQEEIIVGTPIAARRHADLERVVGMFVNTLALRNYPSGEKSFEAFLAEVKDRTLSAYENQEYQFEELVDRLSLKRDVSRNPIFDVMFNYLNQDDYRDARVDDHNREQMQHQEAVAKFDMTLTAVDSGDFIDLTLEYCTKLFLPETINRIIRYSRKIIAELQTSTGKKISEISILPDEEKQRLLLEYNNNAVDYPRNLVIHQWFEKQVKKTPHQVALKYEDKEITYRELNTRSNQWARRLKDKGVQSETIVGLLVDRCLELIIGIMGILKAGGAYLPIDTGYPRERIEYMLKDSHTQVLLFGDQTDTFDFIQNKISLDDTCNLGKKGPDLKNENNLSNLAYIIYTSGTTGKPKGVMVEHRNVVRLFFNDRCLFDFGPGDVWTLFHNPCFDFSVWEIFGAVLFGGKLVIIPAVISKEPGEYLNIMKREKVTVLNQTPSAFYNLARESLEQQEGNLRVRYVIFGGEALYPNKIKEWHQKYPNVKLINMFGITETTVHVTYREISEDDIEANTSNIGKAIPTLSTYIFDPYRKPVARGVYGELYVGGAGVSRGYLGMPELTAQKFVPNPGNPIERLYRSGDLAAALRSGGMQYIGRIDNQVQLRGFRIELAEIEGELLNLDKIKDAKVVDQQDDTGNNYLCAYVVLARDKSGSDAEFDVSDIRNMLSGRLPDYMIPAYFVEIEKIPLTANGKVDKKRLPEPKPTLQKTVIGPRNDIEKRLCEIWEDILKLERVSITASFFSLGGDSIKAIKLLNRINKVFDTSLKIPDLYKNDTVQTLAQWMGKGDLKPGMDALNRIKAEIESLKQDILKHFDSRDIIEDIYPMSDIEKGMVFASLVNPESGVYHDQFVAQVKYPDFKKERFLKALKIMVEKHGILRTGFNVADFETEVQIVYKKVPVTTWHMELHGKKREEQKRFIEEYLHSERNRPFDVSKPPLWRLSCFDLGDHHILIIWQFHHAILDGWSNASLLTELSNVYLQLETEPGFVPLPLKSGYKEFVIEQMAAKRNPHTIDYWQKELEDYKRLNVFGTKKVRAEYQCNLGIKLLEETRSVGQKYNTSLKTICFGAFIYSLYMISYEREILVGLVTDNRPESPDSEKIIGCFLNTVPLRIDIPDPITWKNFIERVNTKMVELKGRDKLSLFEIARIIGENPNQGNPIFDILFNFVDFHIVKETRAKGGEISKDKHLDIGSHETTNTWLNFTVSATGGLFGLRISYRQELIFPAESLAHYFIDILEKIVYSSNELAEKEDIIPGHEVSRLVFEFNQTGREFKLDKPIQDLFKDCVERFPGKTALVGFSLGLRTDIHLSYRELDRRADQVSRRLRNMGMTSEPVTGILSSRSIEMIIGIIGILKAGGAYLPIGIEFPEARQREILENAGSRILLSHDPYTYRFDSDYNVLDVCGIDETMEGDFYVEGSVNDLAYVMYTSGSSGKPKGVMIEHHSVLNLVFSIDHMIYQKYKKNLKVSMVSPYYFDASVKQVFPCLLRGHTLVLVPEDTRLDKGLIMDFYNKHLVDVADGTPLDLGILTDPGSHEKDALSVQHFLIGGEPLSASVVQKVFARFTGSFSITNVYGPTECCDVSTCYHIDPGDIPLSNRQHPSVNDRNDLPIGKPIFNVKTYILDGLDHLQPMGCVGELCIGGTGLARGYLKDESLTTARFTKNPFVQGERLYHSGDLCRWSADGNIEFIGRKDQQVKIRGFRVETGEIEQHLLEIPGIKEAVVAQREDEANEKYLCAYVVVENHELENSLTPSFLKEELAMRLPPYMIPGIFVQLEKLPRTSSGKVNRRLLPGPGRKRDEDYTAPGNALEKKLVDLWSDVLKVEKDIIGIYTNFFELGGHSLKATILVSRIHKELNVRVPLSAIFTKSTIASLSEYIMESRSENHGSITAVEKREYYELSSAQQRLYILQQLEPKSTVYNMVETIKLDIGVDYGKLERVLSELIDRHEGFRTSFVVKDEQPVQMIRDRVEFSLENPEKGERSLEDVISDFVRPFDLSRAPLFRAGLVRLENDGCWLIVDIHHIISDGLSQQLLRQEFFRLWDGDDLPVMRLDYKDFSAWQVGMLQDEMLQHQERYWLNEFSGDIPVLSLATDYSRPAIQSFEGSRVGFSLGNRAAKWLKGICKETGTTLFMVLLSVYNVWLSRLSNQDDTIIGVPVAGRRHTDLEGVIGMFVNTLALRNVPSGDKSFREFLLEVKRNTLEAFENQEYPFEELVDRIFSSRDVSRNPVFDVMFNVLNHADYTYTGEESGWKDDRTYTHSECMCKFDLTLTGVDVGSHIYMILEYCTRLFKPSTIERYIEFFQGIIESLCEGIDEKLYQLEFISEKEKDQLLYEFNDTEAGFPREKTIHGLFEDQVSRYADHVASVDDSSYLTYQCLNERSNKWAANLRVRGVSSGKIAAIMMERSINMLVGLFGILKANGSYLPIEPDTPTRRIVYILSDSGCQFLLTHQEYARDLEGICEVLDFDDVERTNQHRQVYDRKDRCQAADPVYVLYTSGSTGNPKGVLVEHRSVVNIILNLYREYPFFETDGYLFKTSFTFDVSVTEIFGWFLGGGRLVIMKSGDQKDSSRILEKIARESVSHVNFVPPGFNAFLEFLHKDNVSILSSLRYIFLAGEALPPMMIKRCKRLGIKVSLENIYGPTEATIYSSRYPLSEWKEEDNIYIGKPLQNMKLYILGSYNNLAPIGAAGELCISGAGLARGYLNNPERTDEKFKRELPGRIYRTGDLCRWLSCGNIEFLGRMDHQVKIRGFRIELGEIEAQLLNHDGVSEAVVLNREDGYGDRYLCAYIVPKSGGLFDQPGLELKEYLSRILPNYMVPSFFIQLEKLPLTSGGKIDRKALPEPERKGVEAYVGPSDTVEQRLVEIWSGVLNVDKGKIGVLTNFFQLGGHSLKATILMGKIFKEFNTKVPLVQIFQTPLIRKLGDFIKQAQKTKFQAIKPAEKREYYSLSSAQRGIFFHHLKNRKTTAYNLPRIVPVDSNANITGLKKVFQKMITRHDVFRASFKTVNGEPVQIIHPDNEFRMEYYQETEDIGRVIERFVRPFELENAPLLRAGLINGLNEQNILMFDIHHIIMDGVSMNLMIRELMMSHEGVEFPALRIQYRDYVVWENKKEVKEDLHKQKEYWLKSFRKDIPKLKLPLDFQRPAHRTLQGDRFSFMVEKELTSRLKELARQTKTTSYMILLAAYYVMLQKFNNGQEIVVGSPVTGRRHADLQDIMGMFVNMLPIKSRPAPGKTFREFLMEVKTRVLDALANQDYYFEELVAELGLPVDHGNNPLFDVVFSMQNIGASQASEQEFSSQIISEEENVNLYQNKTTKFDLLLNAIEVKGKFNLLFEYSTQLFKPTTIENMSRHYVEILLQIAGDMDTKIENIKMSYDLYTMDTTYTEEEGDFGFEM